jgi:hypothetical protein
MSTRRRSSVYSVAEPVDITDEEADQVRKGFYWGPLTGLGLFTDRSFFRGEALARYDWIMKLITFSLAIIAVTTVVVIIGGRGTTKPSAPKPL